MASGASAGSAPAAGGDRRDTRVSWPSGTPSRWLAVTPGRAAALVLLGAALLPPAWLAAGPPLCPFRALTGLPCPGCGLTRSLVALAHGDLAASLFFHPLGLLLALALVALALHEARTLLPAAVPRPGPRWRSPLLAARLGAERAAWLAAAALLLVWLLRLPLYLAGRWVY